MVGLALTNYQIAKFIQRVLLEWFPLWSYQLTMSVPWFIVCSVPAAFAFSQSGIFLYSQLFLRHWRSLLLLSTLVAAGLVVFVLLGITQYFHSVKYPLIFFLVTPLVEELLFRGWIYGQLEKNEWWPVLGSALLFGLHHLQYFSYRPTPFALFQIAYTFVLGLLFGMMRKKSGSIYPSLLTHMLINWVTVNF